MERNKIEHTTMLVEIPSSLMKEINRFLVEKADGESTQGMKKILVINGIYSFLIDHNWKISNSASKDCVNIIDNARFEH